jgi:hypothetical protein
MNKTPKPKLAIIQVSLLLAQAVPISFWRTPETAAGANFFCLLIKTLKVFGPLGSSFL